MGPWDHLMGAMVLIALSAPAHFTFLFSHFATIVFCFFSQTALKKYIRAPGCSQLGKQAARAKRPSPERSSQLVQYLWKGSKGTERRGRQKKPWKAMAFQPLRSHRGLQKHIELYNNNSKTKLFIQIERDRGEDLWTRILLLRIR